MMVHRCLASCLALALLVAGAKQGQAAERKLTGSLDTIRGVKVLRLSGTARENGYARGYLMASEIMTGVKGGLNALLRKEDDFAEVSKRVIPALVRPDDCKEEVEGIIEGLRAKLGEDALEVPRLGRKLTADDLWVVMALPDAHCSSFAAWGTMAEDGKPIVGRNLDYPGMSVFAHSAAIVVCKSADPKRKSWVDPTIALVTGVMTGINEDGVFIAVHNSEATGKPSPPGYLRWTVLREFIETVSANDDLAARAGAFFRERRILRGTNFMLCGPKPSACVVEYDGNVSLSRGVTLRLPDAGQEWIAVTNHFRLRNKPDPCERYEALDKALRSRAEGGKKLASLQDGWQLIARASQSSTLVTTVFRPADRKLLVSFTDGRSPADKLNPVEFGLDELLGARGAEPAGK